MGNRRPSGLAVSPYLQTFKGHVKLASMGAMMTVSASSRVADFGRWRPALWALFGGLLLLPAIAMLFTDEVRWTGIDFIAAAAIFAVVGCAIELTVRFIDQPVLRTVLVCGVVLAALTIWADGAVGIL